MSTTLFFSEPLFLSPGDSCVAVSPTKVDSIKDTILTDSRCILLGRRIEETVIFLLDYIPVFLFSAHTNAKLQRTTL